VVPWKGRRAYATQALALLLPLARAQGLPYVEVTTDPETVPSQRVIISNGGVLYARFRNAEHFGNSEGLLHRIRL
jgi:predicted acetyltransferase